MKRGEKWKETAKKEKKWKQKQREGKGKGGIEKKRENAEMRTGKNEKERLKNKREK